MLRRGWQGVLKLCRAKGGGEASGEAEEAEEAGDMQHIWGTVRWCQGGNHRDVLHGHPSLSGMIHAIIHASDHLVYSHH